MPHIGLAELRHTGIQVIPLALAVEQHISKPFFGELGAGVGERRRHSTLIAERWLAAGEERLAVWRQATEPLAFMTGPTIKGDHRLFQLLPVIQFQP